MTGRNGAARPDAIDRFYAHARKELEWFRGGWFAAHRTGFISTFDGPARAIRCACALSAAAPRYGVDVRIGVHTGECDVRKDTISGVAVDLAAQVAAHAATGEVLVSRTVKDLVAGSGLRFEDHGKHALEGAAGDWRLFAVERGPQVRSVTIESADQYDALSESGGCRGSPATGAGTCGAAQSPEEIASLTRSMRIVAESIRTATTMASPTIIGPATAASLAAKEGQALSDSDTALASLIDHHQSSWRSQDLTLIGKKNPGRIPVRGNAAGLGGPNRFGREQREKIARPQLVAGIDHMGNRRSLADSRNLHQTGGVLARCVGARRAP